MGDIAAPGLASRRAIVFGLTSGVFAAVSACAAAPTAIGTGEAARPDEQPDLAAAVAPGQAAPADDVPGPSQPVPTTPAVVQPPSKAQLVAEFEGRRPTEWGLAVTGVVTRSTVRPAVITLDACGGSAFRPHFL